MQRLKLKGIVPTWVITENIFKCASVYGRQKRVVIVKNEVNNKMREADYDKFK